MQAIHWNDKRSFGRRMFPASILLLVACGDGLVLGPDRQGARSDIMTSPASAVSASVVDLSGVWQWREINVLQLNPGAVQGFFGIAPEGPVTHITCVAEGTLTVTQTGSTFTGSSTQSGECVTRGGASIPAPIPPALELIDGEIRGRSFQFTMDAGPFPLGGRVLCPYRGAIRVNGGGATLLDGSGDCAIPNEKAFGHEFSPSWTAVR